MLCRGFGGEALEYHEKSLEIKIKSHGIQHASVVMTKDSMGYVYEQLGNLAKAQSCFKEVHTIFYRALGQTTPTQDKQLTTCSGSLNKIS